MNAVENLIKFHEGLNEAIKAWAFVIVALLDADNYKTADVLINNVQPEACFIDRALSAEAQKARK